MSSPADKLLEHIPDTMPGASVNTLACRCDMAHHFVRQQLVRLEPGGRVTHHSIGGKARYYLATEEDRMRHEEETAPGLAARIMAELPLDIDGTEGPTIIQLGGALSVRPNTIAAELKLLITAREVVRHGAGKRGDPFRHYEANNDAASLPEVLAATCTEAELRELAAAAGEENDENEATESTVAAEVEPTGTEVPPDPELPDGYTDAPEVLAAKMQADPASPDAGPRGTSPLQAVADIFDPPLEARLATGSVLRTAYQRVAQDLRLRAREADHDRAILNAGAELLGRIADELAP